MGDVAWVSLHVEAEAIVYGRAVEKIFADDPLRNHNRYGRAVHLRDLGHTPVLQHDSVAVPGCVCTVGQVWARSPD